MKFLLDTNIITKFYDKSADGHIQIRETIANLNESDELAISVLTLYELGYGLANAPGDMKDIVLQKFDQVQEDFLLLPLPPEGALIFGSLKKALKEKRSLEGNTKAQRRPSPRGHVPGPRLDSGDSGHHLRGSTDLRTET